MYDTFSNSNPQGRRQRREQPCFMKGQERATTAEEEEGEDYEEQTPLPEQEQQEQENNEISRSSRRAATTSTNNIQTAMRQSQLLNLFWSKLLLCWISLLFIGILLAWHSSYRSHHHGGVVTVTSSTSHFYHSILDDDNNNNNNSREDILLPEEEQEPPIQITGLSWGSSKEDRVYENGNEDDTSASTNLFWGEQLHEKEGQSSLVPVLNNLRKRLLSRIGGSLMSSLVRTDYLIHSDDPNMLSFSSSVHRHSNQYYHQDSYPGEEDEHEGRTFDVRQQLEDQYTTFTEPQPSPASAYEDGKITQERQEQLEDEEDSFPNEDYGIVADENEAAAQIEPTAPAAPPPPAPKNPAVYGWTPAAFPNPLYNPIRCAIAYLPQFMDHPPPSSSSSSSLSNSNNDNLDTGEMVSPMKLQSSSTNQNEMLQQQQSSHPLRLCDPDWVLGGSYLEQIAEAMNNFTTFFGKQRHEDMWLERQHEEDHSKNRNRLRQQQGWVVPWVDLALATARKMDLTAVLRDNSYYAYEDEDDMVNDAAQLFARGLHDTWWPSTAAVPGDGNSDAVVATNEDALALADHGILIFLSIQDRVCFICTGPAISPVLPWWRLDNIITSMKPALRDRDFGAAILEAISNLSDMLQSGPPSMMDRLHDFCSRFGVVILFATFTFLFGAWGEYRDRRKRYQFAEERSQLKGVDREKACLLQQEYKTRQCPICLESFQSDKAAILSDNNKGKSLNDDDYDNNNNEDDWQSNDELGSGTRGKRDNLDKYGIPLLGADGKRIKILRCGHIFCESCWKSWVHSGCGNPCNCPVCRQDVGKAPRQSIVRNQSSQRRQPTEGRDDTNNSNNDRANPEHQHRDSNTSDSQRASPAGSAARRQPRFHNNNSVWESHPSYDSVVQSRRLTSPSSILAAATAGRLSATLMSPGAFSSLPNQMENSNSRNNRLGDSAPTEQQPLLQRPPPA
ncbi:hypothetical protein ACA910_016419 [Epithemia clementina (nom. ined.)]